MYMKVSKTLSIFYQGNFPCVTPDFCAYCNKILVYQDYKLIYRARTTFEMPKQ